MKKILFVFLFVGLFISCRSVYNGDMPSWINEKPRASGRVVYIGRGEGDSEKKAKEAAFLSVIEQVEDDLGYDVADSYLSEFILSNRITELGTRIDDEWAMEENGQYTYFVKASTPSWAFLSSRNPDYQKIIENESRIETYVNASLDAYKRNEDTVAVNYLLEAIPISATSEIRNLEYMPEKLIERAVEILENIEISFRFEKGNTSEVRVQVKRNKGLFHPNVVNAQIEAVYLMENDTGVISKSSFICLTNDKGYFNFNKTNSYTLRDGEINFYVHLDDNLLKKAINAVGSNLMTPILECIEDSEKVHTYKEGTTINSRDIIIALGEYDINGQVRGGDVTLRAFRNYLEDTGVKDLSVVNAPKDADPEDLLYDLVEQYPNKRFFIVVRVGITDYRENNNSNYVRAEGDLILFDNEAPDEIKIYPSSSVGYNPILKNAEDIALETEARMIAAQLLEEF